MQTFEWEPLVAPVGQTSFRTLKAQFGDGYSQAAADGINAQITNWPLTFTGKRATILPIKAFLDAHGGWKSFLWTAPLDQEAGTYRTPQGYRLTPLGADLFSLEVTLEQVFHP